MDASSRRTLDARLHDLPPDYALTRGDDFVNWERRDGCCGSYRVLRVVGPRRCLLIFGYEPGHRPSRHSRLYYHAADGSRVEFDPNPIYNRVQAASPQRWSWDRAIAEWLENTATPPAMTFRGRGWADRCTRAIKTLVGRWDEEFRPVLEGR